ncbi:MAG: TolC family protein [Flavobacteriales bacterium]
MKKIVKKFVFLIICFLQGIYSQGLAQEDNSVSWVYRFTFEEAIAYGAENNYDIKKADYDFKVAEKKVWEAISKGLPQIDGMAQYQNNLKQPITLLPGEIVGGSPGTFIKTTFGTKQTMTAGVGWNQLIFNGNYLVAIQVSKVSKRIEELTKNKTEIEVKTAVAQAYSSVIIAEENVKILEKNIEVAEKNLHESSESYKAGFIELQSVEQLELSLAQLKNAYERSKRLINISKDNLKFVMGIPVTDNITLEDTIDDMITKNLTTSLVEEKFDIENNVDYLISQKAIRSKKLLLRLNKSNALPSLRGSLNYSYTKGSKEFPLSDDEFSWYPSLVLGVNLNVPIFSSFKRNSQRQQAKIELEKAYVTNTQLEEQLELEVRTQRTSYENSVETYYVSKDNMKLAEKIYKKERIKYFGGISTSNDLRVSENQYYNTQSDYVTSVLNLINAKIALDKALNKYN